MNYLIDTNIISEIRKKRRCDRNVAAWYAVIEDDEMFLSVLVAGEIRNGIELARRRDPRKATALEQWLKEVDIGLAIACYRSIAQSPMSGAQ